jgi:uncharacterized repeat protein (TIGR01451 family)
MLSVRRTLSVCTVLTLSAFAILPMTGISMVDASHSQCSDSIDNDGDGRVDYPSDIQCANSDDNDESTGTPDITLSVTDGRTVAYPGDSVTYNVTVRNNSAARTLDVRLSLPAEANLINPGQGGQVDGKTVVWRAVYMDTGTTRFSVDVQLSPNVKGGVQLSATADVGGTRASDLTQLIDKVITLSTIKMTLTDGKENVRAGDDITYTATVTNVGDGPRTFDLRMNVPSQTVLVSTDGSPIVRDENVIWTNQYLDRGETKRYKMTLHVSEDRLPPFARLYVRASTNFETVTDVNLVQSTLQHFAQISVSVDDGLQSAAPGDLVTYTIHLNNRHGSLEHSLDVANAIPLFSEFVSATEGGRWNGENVRWENVTVSPNSTRSLQLTVRVRSDATIGQQLRDSVYVNGYSASDTTMVAGTARKGSNGNTSGGTRSTTRSERSDAALQIFADRSEVVPGDTITYTIVVRNTKSQTVQSVRVESVLPTDVRVTDTGGSTVKGNTLHWTIGSLGAGDIWRAQYSVRVDRSAKHGRMLATRVSIEGSDVSSLSLGQRTQRIDVGVVGSMPRTGAALDAIFASITGALATVPTVLQRRRMRMI